jgi:hypothetical protein
MDARVGMDALRDPAGSLIEWIVPQTVEHYLPVKPFHDALPDQSTNTFQVAHSDLRSLERRSLAGLAVRAGRH